MNFKKPLLLITLLLFIFGLCTCGDVVPAPIPGTTPETTLKTSPKLQQSPLVASEIRKIKIHSTLLKKDMNINVYLPKGYSSATKYPVLYILHGYSGDEDSIMYGVKFGEKLDELISSNKIKPLIIISPKIDNSYGINSSQEPITLGTPPDNSLNEGMYEDYLTKEVVSYIDSNYSTIKSRDTRYIGGISMGGFAALHIAFNHPDMFSKVGGHSPALYVDQTPYNVKEWLYPDESTRKERDPIYMAQNKDLKSLKVYLDCGDKDEFKFYEGCDKLYKVLQSKGVPSEYHLNPGTHKVEYWIPNIEKYLVFYTGV